MTIQKDYLSAAETATLLRKALAREFPETRFYVRSKTYAGGASIRVAYDGTEKLEQDPVTFRYVRTYKPGAPTYEDVTAVADLFAGGGFDGMIDLAYYVTSWITPDGRVVATASTGTTGSAGSVSGWSDPVPAGARPVSFGAKYVFVEPELPYDVRMKGR